jgi:hypothetical protein
MAKLGNAIVRRPAAVLVPFIRARSWPVILTTLPATASVPCRNLGERKLLLELIFSWRLGCGSDHRELYDCPKALGMLEIGLVSDEKC